LPSSSWEENVSIVLITLPVKAELRTNVPTAPADSGRVKLIDEEEGFGKATTSFDFAEFSGSDVNDALPPVCT